MDGWTDGGMDGWIPRHIVACRWRELVSCYAGGNRGFEIMDRSSIEEATCQTGDLHGGTGHVVGDLDSSGLHAGQVTCETVVVVGSSHYGCGDHDKDRK